MSKRTHWFSKDLGIKDEPLAKSLLEYRQSENRTRVIGEVSSDKKVNLVSSITDDGKQMPILDMDFPHKIIRSTTIGHSHLYIDVVSRGPIRDYIAVKLLYVIWKNLFGKFL